MTKNNYRKKDCFDLTTDQGMKSCLDFLGNGYFGLIAPSPLKLIGDLVKGIFDSKRTEAQAEVAEKLIKKGKDNGIDEMDITMDNTRVFKLKVPIEGINIETKLGPDEKMRIKVKYK